MVGRLLPSVELKVGIVKNVLSKLRINQTPCQLVGKRRGTTGFAGDLRKATNSILAKLEHCISSMTRAQKAETFAVSSRRPIRNGGRTAGESRKYRIIRTLDSSLTCNQYAKKKPKGGSRLATLKTENRVKTNS